MPLLPPSSSLASLCLRVRFGKISVEFYLRSLNSICLAVCLSKLPAQHGMRLNMSTVMSDKQSDRQRDRSQLPLFETIHKHNRLNYRVCLGKNKLFPLFVKLLHIQNSKLISLNSCIKFGQLLIVLAKCNNNTHTRTLEQSKQFSCQMPK